MCVYINTSKEAIAIKDRIRHMSTFELDLSSEYLFPQHT